MTRQEATFASSWIAGNPDWEHDRVREDERSVDWTHVPGRWWVE